MLSRQSGKWMRAEINFANTNSVWASFLVETLVRLGIRRAVVAPGSRSAPLTIALANHPKVDAIPVIDERSGSFLALGLARKSGKPAVLVCTSGTAAANFFPAVIEASESGVPLLVLTADRPPELRACGAGQTIDQVKLFGQYPRMHAELALPEASREMLAYLRQTLAHAVARSRWPSPGPVHLNVPFRDPLVPVPDDSAGAIDDELIARLLADVAPEVPGISGLADADLDAVAAAFAAASRPMIVAGPAQPWDRMAYVAAIVELAGRRRAPILADALSPVRQRGAASVYLIENYEAVFARDLAPEEKPDLVLRFGPLPTSKRLRKWLGEVDAPQYVAEESDRNVDPLHTRAIHLRTSAVRLARALTSRLREASEFDGTYAEKWRMVSEQLGSEIDVRLEECAELFEGKIPWLISRHAPPGTAVFLSNSLPVRDAEYFWRSRAEPVDVYFNRGANGIDGIVSTAAGIAADGASVILVTGDLAFLHDQNGLLNAHSAVGGMTILLINNGGGGIFHSLPVADFDPPFTKFFPTPQDVDFGAICAAHGIAYARISRWENVLQAIGESTRGGEVRVFEIRSDAVRDREFRNQLLCGKSTPVTEV